MAALSVVALLGAKPVARSWRPLEFHVAEEKNASGLIPMSIAGSAGAIYSGRIYLDANIELDERDVVKATVISDKFDYPVVELQLSRTGVAKINALVQGHKRSILAIVAAGKVVSALQILFDRVGDTLDISSEFSAKEAARLADSINAK
jgi:preprotein translocase subunit SecD